MQPAARILREAGLNVLDVDADTARLIEPGLASDNELAGALHLPDGESGNCRLFAQMLRYAAQERGVQFLFQSRVEALQGGPAGVRLAGERDARRFDAVVVCAGVSAAALLRGTGTAMPLAALHGYTLSAPVREDTHAPQGTVIDPLHRITVTRQGQRVRVAGGAELGPGGGAPHAPTLQTLYNAASGWFPGGAQWSSPQVQTWRGARPMLPDGLPVVERRRRARCVDQCRARRVRLGPGLRQRPRGGRPGRPAGAGDGPAALRPAQVLTGAARATERATMASRRKACRMSMIRIEPDRPHPLFDVPATRRIEQAALRSLPAGTLMERAGLAVARLAQAVAPHARHGVDRLRRRQQRRRRARSGGAAGAPRRAGAGDLAGPAGRRPRRRTPGLGTRPGRTSALR